MSPLKRTAILDIEAEPHAEEADVNRQCENIAHSCLEACPVCVNCFWLGQDVMNTWHVIDL